MLKSILCRIVVEVLKDSPQAAAVRIYHHRAVGNGADKIKACGFTVAAGAGGAPYFQEAELVLVCRKLYWQDIDPARFLDPGIDAKWYPGKDYHRMYVGEIVEVYRNN